MNYGKMIRSAREELGLYLKDFSQQNLSFNLLSNIEVGKTKLTKQKALMLYKVILKESWKKKIFPVSDFDEILCDDKEYLTIKESHEFCLYLYELFKEKKELSQADFNQALKLVGQKEVDLLSFQIYYFTANLLAEDSYKDKLAMYEKALDSLYWSNMEEYMWIYKQCLIESISVAYEVSNHKMLIKYYTILLEAEEKYSVRIDTKIYYNLSLFHNIVGDWQVALEYLNMYLSKSYDLSLRDEVDCKILKTAILGKSGQYKKAIDLSEEILAKIEDENLLYQESLCMSNILFWHYKLKSNGQDVPVLKYITNLMSLMMSDDSMRQSNDGLYLNLALGFTLVSDSRNALVYFKKSIESAPNDKRKLVVLAEGIDAFWSTEAGPWIVSSAMEIDYDSLKDKEKLMYVRLLLKIRHNIEAMDVEDELKKAFLLFVEAI